MANTNFDVSFTPVDGWVDLIAKTNTANASLSGYTTIANPTGGAVTIYNKGSQPFFVVISLTQPGRQQPWNPSVTMGVPIYPAGQQGSSLAIPSGASGIWAWCPYLTAYALVQN